MSGFCGLVYEVVWLRLSMAAFGVTTPMVSIVLSVFMAGLALGSWGAGRLIPRFGASSGGTALRLYALSELVIGVSGVAVPIELRWGRDVLARFGSGLAWGSGAHYAASGVWVTIALLPFCTAMGATFPLAMAALQDTSPARRARSFSYLYLANVIGATTGTLASALFLVELFGFQGTLILSALLNAALAIAAFLLGRGSPPIPAVAPRRESSPVLAGSGHDRAVPWLLFTTGLLSMAMEVVWVRQFTPYLGTVVYTFAGILALYLAATFLGSMAYRRSAASTVPGGSHPMKAGLWVLAGLFALLPLLLADPRGILDRNLTLAIGRVACGIGPFCFAVGFLTPMLIDRWSGGDPVKAGAVYAVNVIGGILGPLVACFILLPAIGEHWSLAVLALPLFAAGAALAASGRPMFTARQALAGGGAALAAMALMVFTKDFETVFARREVLRDSTATVIAAGEGRGRQLLVNGYGMTVLSPITKMMAHLPLASRAERPQRVLVICFGMGTSFRSSLSWGVSTTVVELIPSVPSLFGYFHADATRVMASPDAHVVIDDGRRFLERSRARFDVITVDPPPPVEAAGSSLLYSREFFEVARSRLAPDGILQHWFPGGEPIVLSSIAKALTDTFPYVRVFNSHEGWGYHFLASVRPIPAASAVTLAGRLPARAAADMIEWEPGTTPVDHFAAILARELPMGGLITPGAPALSDDRPLNEYYLLRTLSGRRR